MATPTQSVYNPYSDLAKSIYNTPTNSATQLAKDKVAANSYASASVPSSIQNPYSQKTNIGNVGMAGLSGFAAGTASAAKQGDYSFEFDPMSSISSSISGGSSGGPWGAVAGGVLDTVGQEVALNNKLEALDTNVNLMGTDANGRPTYSGTQMLDAQAKLKGLQPNAYQQVVSTADVIGLFRMDKMKKKRKQIATSMANSAQAYNDAIKTQNQQDLAKQQYADLTNNRTRFNNLYSINPTLY